MSCELFIIGTSGLAKETAQLARQIDPNGQRWNTVSFVTDEVSKIGQKLLYGFVSKLDIEVRNFTKPVDVAIGIGYPKLRQKITRQMLANQYLNFPNLIHPDVDIDPTLIHMGCGNMITKGVVMTCDIVVGNFNLFNWNSTIGHDAVIGDYNVINPGSSVSGRVHLGNACMLGTGARILEDITIGSDITIGAGAVVTKSITQAGTYIGIPAQLKQLRGEEKSSK